MNSNHPSITTYNDLYYDDDDDGDDDEESSTATSFPLPLLTAGVEGTGEEGLGVATNGTELLL